MRNTPVHIPFLLTAVLMGCDASSTNSNTPATGDGGATAGGCPLIERPPAQVMGRNYLTWTNDEPARFTGRHPTLPDASIEYVFRQQTTNPPLLCRHTASPDGGTDTDPHFIWCSSGVRDFPALHMVFRFREPFENVPTGAVLRLGQEFTLERLWLINGTTSDTQPSEVRTDGRGPFLGNLTMRVMGPPECYRTNACHPAPRVPTVFLEGLMCGAPLTVRFNLESRADY